MGPRWAVCVDSIMQICAEKQGRLSWGCLRTSQMSRAVKFSYTLTCWQKFYTVIFKQPSQSVRELDCPANESHWHTVKQMEIQVSILFQGRIWRKWFLTSAISKELEGSHKKVSSARKFLHVFRLTANVPHPIWIFWSVWAKTFSICIWDNYPEFFILDRLMRIKCM